MIINCNTHFIFKQTTLFLMKWIAADDMFNIHYKSIVHVSDQE